MANELNSNICYQGKPLAVTGTPITRGGKLPTLKLTGLDLQDLDYAPFAGKTLIISVVPSVDTSTCALQTKRFNEEASKIPNATILTVSVDLPFAQKRWCGAEGVKNLVMGSDYKYRSFGENFGTYIPSMGLLTRAVFVANRAGIITYVDYVPNLSDEPNYEEVLRAATI